MYRVSSRENRAFRRRLGLDGISNTLLVALLLIILGNLALAQPAPKVEVPQAASAAPVVVTFPNPNIFLSPYNWRIAEDGSIWAPIGGPYMKFSVTGTSEIIANIDTTINRGLYMTDYPTLKVSIDDGPATFVQFPPDSDTVILAYALTPGTHTVLAYAIGGNQNAPSSWSGTIGQTHIKSLQFDAGSTLSAYPRIYGKNCLIYGDSYVGGYGGLRYYWGITPYYKVTDPSITWAIQLGWAMGCEVGVVAVGGSGYLQPVPEDGWPALSEYWNHYDSLHLRSFSPAPDYTINALGFNDHRHLGWMAPDVQGAVQKWLMAVRSTLPATKLFLYVPVGGMPEDEDGTGGANATPIRNAVKAVGDPNTFLIDAGTQLVTAVNWPHPSWFTGPDGMHPAVTSHGILAAIAVQQMQKVLDGGATTPAAQGLQRPQ